MNKSLNYKAEIPLMNSWNSSLVGNHCIRQ